MQSNLTLSGIETNLCSTVIKYVGGNRNPRICNLKLELVNGFEWYVLEYDPESFQAFGFVNLNDPKNAEFGYFNVNELQRLVLHQPIKNLITGRLSQTLELRIEIDETFRPTPIQVIVDQIKSRTKL